MRRCMSCVQAAHTAWHCTRDSATRTCWGCPLAPCREDDAVSLPKAALCALSFVNVVYRHLELLIYEGGYEGRAHGVVSCRPSSPRPNESRRSPLVVRTRRVTADDAQTAAASRAAPAAAARRPEPSQDGPPRSQEQAPRRAAAAAAAADASAAEPPPPAAAARIAAAAAPKAPRRNTTDEAPTVKPATNKDAPQKTAGRRYTSDEVIHSSAAKFAFFQQL